VIWDAEDPASDVYLDAALSVARALCTRAASRDAGQQADIELIERSIRAIEKQAEGLDEITRSTETIRSAAGKILERARIVREGLEREVGRLDGALQDLRAMLGDGSAGA
jgi:tRNA(Ser,Leu) C12 N-acetylase TAN1